MDFVELCAMHQVQPSVQRVVRIGTTDTQFSMSLVHFMR